MDEILNNIAAQASTLTPVLYGLLVAAGLDILTGLYAAAVSPGGITWDIVANFVKSHVLQRVAPIFLALVAGVAIGGTDSAGGTALIATAAAGGAAYLAETVASIAGNLGAARAKDKGEPTR
jgi:hypothetical protein